MKAFTRLRATAAPIMRSNIDTDQIIRIDRLIEHRRGELGPFCMEALRYLPDGSEAWHQSSKLGYAILLS